MVVSDGVVETIQGVLGSHMASSAETEVASTPVSIGPTFMGAHYKVRHTKGRSWVDGEPNDSVPDVGSDHCLRLRVYSGNRNAGQGVAEASISEAGEHPRFVGMHLDIAADDIVKASIEAYLRGVGNSVSDTQNGLQHNGKREKVVHRGEESDRLDRFEELSDLVLPRVRHLEGPGRIVNTSVSFEVVDSAYVDTNGSDIRQSATTAIVGLELLGYGSDGKPMCVQDALVLTSVDQFQDRFIDRKIERLQQRWEASQQRVRTPTGSYPIILDGAAVGTLIHEAIAAHLLSGAYVLGGESNVYTPDRLNTQVLPEMITIVDDPTLAGWLGSYEYDEQGVKSRRVVLVENGVLKDYLLDVSSAAKLSQYLGREVNSNGRARSQWASIGGKLLRIEPRVSNLQVQITPEYLASKEDLWGGFSEVISASQPKAGIYVEGGGGEVNISNGMFELHPGAAWLVDESGRHRLLEGGRIVGSTDHLFGNLIAFGAPYKSGFGHCGADSGFVPTQERAPSMLLSGAFFVADGKDTSTARLATGYFLT